MPYRHAALALLVALASASADADCLPQVHAEALPLQVVEDHDRTIAEVTQINQTSSHALTRAGMGLGSTFMRSLVQAQLDVDAAGCPTLRVQVGYPTMQLYVARELRDNACAFDHVRRHELEHVAIYRRWLAVVPARIERRLAAELPAVMRLPRAERLAPLLASALAELSRVQAAHDALDSPEEYRSNNMVCDGFVPQLLARLAATVARAPAP